MMQTYPLNITSCAYFWVNIVLIFNRTLSFHLTLLRVPGVNFDRRGAKRGIIF